MLPAGCWGNGPRKNGFETLSAIRNDPKLKVLPVLILTSSDADQDVLQSYKLQANAYVVKPFDNQASNPIAKAIENVWLQTVNLPTRGPG